MFLVKYMFQQQQAHQFGQSPFMEEAENSVYVEEGNSAMWLKVRKALEHPELVLPYLGGWVRRLGVRRIVKDEQVFYKYAGVLYPGYLNEGNAASFILDKAKYYCQGKGIDMGASEWPFPGAVPIQEAENQNAYRLDAFSDGSLDYVFSSHCLEHLDRWQDALRLWICKLRTGGVLFLYLPHVSNELWKPGGPWVGDGHVWSPTWEVLCPFLEGEGMAILEFSRGRDRYWSFHIAARRER